MADKSTWKEIDAKRDRFSGRDLVALWAGYCRTPHGLLLTNYMLDPVGHFWWHAPLKSPVERAKSSRTKPKPSRIFSTSAS